MDMAINKMTITEKKKKVMMMKIIKVRMIMMVKILKIKMEMMNRKMKKVMAVVVIRKVKRLIIRM